MQVAESLWIRRGGMTTSKNEMRKRQSTDGFTLVEVLIAVGILAVGILAVMQLFPIALTQSRQAAEKTAATQLASSEVNKLRAQDLGPAIVDEWLKTNANHDLNNAEYKAERAGALYQGWQATVERVAGVVPLYRVTFRINMLDGKTTETYVTYVTRP